MFTTKKHYYVIEADNVEVTRFQYPVHNTIKALQTLQIAIDQCEDMVNETGKTYSVLDTQSGKFIATYSPMYFAD